MGETSSQNVILRLCLYLTLHKKTIKCDYVTRMSVADPEILEGGFKKDIKKKVEHRNASESFAVTPTFPATLTLSQRCNVQVDSTY